MAEKLNSRSDVTAESDDGHSSGQSVRSSKSKSKCKKSPKKKEKKGTSKEDNTVKKGTETSVVAEEKNQVQQGSVGKDWVITFDKAVQIAGQAIVVQTVVFSQTEMQQACVCVQSTTPAIVDINDDNARKCQCGRPKDCCCCKDHQEFGNLQKQSAARDTHTVIMVQPKEPHVAEDIQACCVVQPKEPPVPKDIQTCCVVQPKEPPVEKYIQKCCVVQPKEPPVAKCIQTDCIWQPKEPPVTKCIQTDCIAQPKEPPVAKDIQTCCVVQPKDSHVTKERRVCPAVQSKRLKQCTARDIEQEYQKEYECYCRVYQLQQRKASTTEADTVGCYDKERQSILSNSSKSSVLNSTTPKQVRRNSKVHAPSTSSCLELPETVKTNSIKNTAITPAYLKPCDKWSQSCKPGNERACYGEQTPSTTTQQRQESDAESNHTSDKKKPTKSKKRTENKGKCCKLCFWKKSSKVKEKPSTTFSNKMTQVNIVTDSHSEIELTPVRNITKTSMNKCSVNDLTTPKDTVICMNDECTDKLSSGSGGQRFSKYAPTPRRVSIQLKPEGGEQSGSECSCACPCPQDAPTPRRVSIQLRPEGGEKSGSESSCSCPSQQDAPTPRRVSIQLKPESSESSCSCPSQQDAPTPRRVSIQLKPEGGKQSGSESSCACPCEQDAPTPRRVSIQPRPEEGEQSGSESSCACPCQREPIKVSAREREYSRSCASNSHKEESTNERKNISQNNCLCVRQWRVEQNSKNTQMPERMDVQVQVSCERLDCPKKKKKKCCDVILVKEAPRRMEHTVAVTVPGAVKAKATEKCVDPFIAVTELVRVKDKVRVCRDCACSTKPLDVDYPREQSEQNVPRTPTCREICSMSSSLEVSRTSSYNEISSHDGHCDTPCPCTPRLPEQFSEGQSSSLPSESEVLTCPNPQSCRRLSEQELTPKSTECDPKCLPHQELQRKSSKTESTRYSSTNLSKESKGVKKPRNKRDGEVPLLVQIVGAIGG